MATEPGKEPTKEAGSTATDAIGVAEFTALRAEIMQRSSFQQQLINLSVLFAGGLLTTYFHFNGPTYLLLCYPILALFMALEWSFNNRRIHQIGKYIREKIENLTPRWERHLKESSDSTSWLSGAVLAYGAFTVLPILVVALTFTRFCGTDLEKGFLGIDALVLSIAACTIHFSQKQ